MISRRRGVPADLDLTPEEQLIPVREEGPVADETAGWVASPTVVDQMVNQKYTGLWKEGAVSCEVFDILTPDGLKGYKTILSECHPHEAPKKVILSSGTYQVGESIWMVLHYRDILYRKLI
jgi:hypothetical protein